MNEVPSSESVSSSEEVHVHGSWVQKPSVVKSAPSKEISREFGTVYVDGHAPDTVYIDGEGSGELNIPGDTRVVIETIKSVSVEVTAETVVEYIDTSGLESVTYANVYYSSQSVENNKSASVEEVEFHGDRVHSIGPIGSTDCNDYASYTDDISSMSHMPSMTGSMSRNTTEAPYSTFYNTYEDDRPYSSFNETESLSAENNSDVSHHRTSHSSEVVVGKSFSSGARSIYGSASYDEGSPSSGEHTNFRRTASPREAPSIVKTYSHEVSIDNFSMNDSRETRTAPNGKDRVTTQSTIIVRSSGSSPDIETANPNRRTNHNPDGSISEYYYIGSGDMSTTASMYYYGYSSGYAYTYDSATLSGSETRRVETHQKSTIHSEGNGGSELSDDETEYISDCSDVNEVTDSETEDLSDCSLLDIVNAVANESKPHPSSSEVPCKRDASSRSRTRRNMPSAMKERLYQCKGHSNSTAYVAIPPIYCDFHKSHMHCNKSKMRTFCQKCSRPCIHVICQGIFDCTHWNTDSHSCIRRGKRYPHCELE